MPNHADKGHDKQSKQKAIPPSRKSKESEAAPGHFVDNSPEARQLTKLQAIIDNSPQAKKLAQLQAMVNGGPSLAAHPQLTGHASGMAQQRQEIPEEDKQELQMKAGPALLQRQSGDDGEIFQSRVAAAQRGKESRPDVMGPNALHMTLPSQAATGSATKPVMPGAQRTIQMAPVIQMTPDEDLFSAINSQDLDMLKIAFLDGGDVDARDDEGFPVIIRAVMKEWEEGLGVILGKPVNIHQLTPDGHSALQYAVYRRNEAIVDLLLTGGASPVVPDDLLAFAIGESTPSIIKRLYLETQRVGREVKDEELTGLTFRLYGDEDFVKPELKKNLSRCFLEIVAERGSARLNAGDADALAASMRAYATGVYAELATRLDVIKGRADRSQHPAYNLVVRHIASNIAQVRGELASSKENALKWLGHVLALEGRAEDVRLSQWQPLQALFFKCYGLRRLLTAKSEDLDERQTEFMQTELNQCLFAFQRAAEVHVVQFLFKPLGLHEEISTGLARSYAVIAKRAGTFRFPAGTWLHATYVTGSEAEGRFTVAHHNLGTGVSRHQREGALMGQVGRYYPHVVERVSEGDLSSIFEMMVIQYIGSGGHEAFNTQGTLDMIYTRLEEKGTLLGDRRAFIGRFRPLMQQLANNCTWENLGSAADIVGVRTLGMENYTRFMVQLSRWETEMATASAGEHAARETMVDLTTKRRYISQYRLAAITGNNDQMVALVRDHAVAINETFNNGTSALILASSLGHTQVCQTLIRAHARLDIQDDTNDTALHWAANKGYLAICTALVGAGARTDITNNAGQYAAECRHLPIVRLLTSGKPTVHVDWKVFGSYEVPFYSQANTNVVLGQLGRYMGDLPILGTSGSFLKIVVVIRGTPYFGYVQPGAEGLKIG